MFTTNVQRIRSGLAVLVASLAFGAQAIAQDLAPDAHVLLMRALKEDAKTGLLQIGDCAVRDLYEGQGNGRKVEVLIARGSGPKPDATFKGFTESFRSEDISHSYMRSKSGANLLIKGASAIGGNYDELTLHVLKQPSGKLSVLGLELKQQVHKESGILGDRYEALPVLRCGKRDFNDLR